MGWYEAVTGAMQAIDKLKNAEANEAMAAVRMEGAKLAEENARLREESIALRQRLQNREELVFEGNAYWTRDEHVGPFCSKCLDDGDKRVRMHHNPNAGIYFCRVCPTSIDDPRGRRRQQLRPYPVDDMGNWDR